MKSFFWKFVICLAPCVAAAIITGIAVTKFQRGETGGLAIKLGTDLSGGTNLVYEIDLPRTRDAKDGGFDPARDINILAEALKRRIDPNDLYNIIIRPAGGEGRVEIILPTGGTQRAQKAEAAWAKLLDEVKNDLKKNGINAALDIPRGKVFELADQIQILQSTDKWENKLFRDAPAPKDTKAEAKVDAKDAKDPKVAKDANPGEAAWKRLKNEAVEYWAGLEPYRKDMSSLDNQPNRLKALSEFIVTKLANNPSEEGTTEKVVDAWIKKQAWNELLVRIETKWKGLGLKDYDAEMKQIEPDSFEQLIGFVQSRGVLEAQAGLAVIEPLVGSDIVFNDDITPTRKEIEEFVQENYGESAASILKKIEKQTDKEGRGRDLSMEEVQRLKDLIAKVGSLEFRILANSEDDKQGIAAAKALINLDNTAVQEKIKKAQETGAPPPAPDEPFTISLPNNNKSIVKYEWVELGPQERKSLNLDNASKNDPDPRVSHRWKEAFFKSKSDKAFNITDVPGGNKNILQGALFYRRESKNRNLPEDERRKKDVEYFILTRTPEYDPADTSKQTSKISGDFLTNAMSSMDGVSPAVHFTFNNEGGRLFGNITRKNVPSGTGGEDSQIKRFLAIILDDQVASAPSINSVITTNGQISGNFTRKEVDNLVNILRAGRLPATLKPQPVSETTMGATLGADTIEKGVLAVMLAFMAVLVFMCIYYRLPGVVASIALLANLLLTVGFMIGVQATFTLPGLAGLVLMLGMAVDANVLIYERLREERERGAALPVALRNAYGRALPTIIDTHLSSIFTAIVLYVVGNDQLKGFGVSLTAGLVISLFTSLYMTHVIFDWLLAKGIFTDFHPMKLFAKPNFDFMSIRHAMFTGTLITAIAGMVLFIYRLPDDLNIDFIGGTAYSGQLTQAVKIEELRKYFDENHQSDYLKLEGAGVSEEQGFEGTRYLVKFKGEDKGHVIVLANKIEGDSPAARVEAVKRRVTQFPDVSIEQSFPSALGAKYEANKTPHFTVRTSEKETEIVQTVLDRLLRQADGTPLLKKVYLKADPLTTRETRLRFSDDKAGTVPDVASPSFVKALFFRELLSQFKIDPKDKKELPVIFEVTGEGSAAPDGRYPILRVRFDSELKPEQKEKVEAALTKLVSEFEARPQPERLENFDSQLANETRYRAMWAILASWAAILVYLWFRFGNWTFGLAAVICLVHDLFLTLGVIAACHYVAGTFLGNMFGLDDFKIDLPSVAALLTLVGYSVNDTIVVFDRIREVRGKNPDLTEKMINDSVNQTLSRTVLASLTTWLVVFVLYVFGGPGVHLFAFVMVVGVIVGTYSSIYIASPLLLMLGEGHKETAVNKGPGKTPQIQGSPA
jgi:SecD/SecF fusion protein